MAPRFSTPRDKYDPQDEAAFRRMIADALTNEFAEIRIGGGVLYGEAGNLKFKSKNGTVTVLALL